MKSFTQPSPDLQDEFENATCHIKVTTPHIKYMKKQHRTARSLYMTPQIPDLKFKHAQPLQ